MGFPDDSDGAALRRVFEGGSDMSRPMYIDFAVAVPSKEVGEAIAEKARKLGYRSELSYDDESRAWTCNCSTRMLATYEGVLAIQAELAELSVPLGGYPDGWGTFGNGPNGQPDVK